MAEYDFDQTLAANEQKTVPCPGSAKIQVIVGSAIFWVQPDGRGNIPLELGLGQRIKGGFDRLRIVNGDTAQRIALKITDGDVTDNRLVGQVDITGGIRIGGYTGGSFGAVTVDSTATLIKAANSARGKLTIQAPSSADIYIGLDNSVTVSNGIRIPAGGSVPVENTAAIYGIAATDGQDVRWWEDLTS
ncbi:MAG: hypothetical protein AB2696_21185 [Candidatus Thiodiazotropha sp.]